MPRLNAEQYVRSYLERELTDVMVRVSVPDPMPSRIVIVKRAAGRRIDALRESVGVHLSIYGGSEWETSELAAEVGDLMYALNRSNEAMLGGISRVREEALRSDPDDQTQPNRPRWFASYTITTHRY